MKEKAVLLIAVLVGLLAFWMTNRYLQAERERLYEGAEMVKVLVAGRDLPAGSVLAIDDLAQKSMYKTAVGDNVFQPEEVDRLLGKKLKYSLKKAEPVWWSYIELPFRAMEGLAPMVKPTLRAISISVGGADAVSGLVRPNDRVDILGTFSFPARDNPAEMENTTLTLLQDVTVLATGQELANQELMRGAPQAYRPGGYSTVTIEATPREAELLVFAQHVQGQLTLSLRNPEDVSYESDLPSVNFDHLQNALPDLNLYRQRNIRHKTAP